KVTISDTSSVRGVERNDVTAFSGTVQSCSPLAAITGAVGDQSRRGAGVEAAGRRAVHQDRETPRRSARSAILGRGASHHHRKGQHGLYRPGGRGPVPAVAA